MIKTWIIVKSVENEEIIMAIIMIRIIITTVTMTIIIIIMMIMKVKIGNHMKILKR